VSFKNTSIKNKLRIIILLTSTIVLCLSTTAFVISELFTFRRDMITNLFVLADLVGINSTPGLVFDNDEGANEDIAVLEANQHIILAHVFSADGEVFTSYLRQGAKESYEFTNVHDYYAYHNKNNSKEVKDSYFFEDDHVDIFKKIIFKDQVLGIVFIQSDLDILNERLILDMIIISTVLLLSLILAFLLASHFQRIITVPIDELLKIMKVTSKAKNYSHRAKKTTNDEMGTLVDGFNTMLSKIETGTQELSKARDQALATNLELEKARDQAMAANKAKSIFLANMSHELRTPLNGILGFTQIFKLDQNLSDEQRSGIDVIHRSGEHLLSLITDILDLSKIEADRIELNPINFRLDTCLKNIIDLFKIRCKTKGLIFVYEALSHLPKSVHADEKRLRQILINLLGNAIKFTKEGQITLKAGYHNEQIRFQVEDTGAGISEEEIMDIFKPFHQVGDKTLHAEGTGLGLTITKKLVEMMGGELHVKSTLGKGTVFWLTVNLPEVDSPIEDEEHNQSVIVGFKETGYRILVADDRSENRHFLIRFLMPLGFEIAEAADGVECLEKAREFHPDLILMDLVMPLMDGFEATRQIRQTPELKDIIVIMITASAFEWHKKQSEEAGCDGFIAKPVSTQELLEFLKKYLKLTWIYKDGDSVQAEEFVESIDEEFEELLGPSEEQAKILLNLVMMGDICSIIEEVEKFEKDNRKIIPFANKIRALSKNYEMGNIQCLIEHYVKDKKRIENEEKKLEQKNYKIPGPSKEQTAILLNLAKMGDLDNILKHIEKYEQSDEKLKTFADEIREFAQNFEINAIRVYIENYMKTQ